MQNHLGQSPAVAVLSLDPNLNTPDGLPLVIAVPGISIEQNFKGFPQSEIVSQPCKRWATYTAEFHTLNSTIYRS